MDIAAQWQRNPRTSILALPIFFFGIVVLLGWITNHHLLWMVYLILPAQLLLPFFDRPVGALRRALRPGPVSMWALAAALSLLGVIGAVALIAGARTLIGESIHLPGGVTVRGLFAEQISLLLPLALAEEFFFRGYLQEKVGREIWAERRLVIGRLSLSYRNLFASALFGLAHVIALTSPHAAGTFFSGLILGEVVERSRGSIGPATLLHTGFNFISTLFLHLLMLNFPLFLSRYVI